MCSAPRNGVDKFFQKGCGSLQLKGVCVKCDTVSVLGRGGWAKTGDRFNH